MVLHLLPERTGGAAENMALDFLLLQRYPAATQPRFRHYGWRGPAFTFGLSQKLEFVQTQLPPDETFDLCRRPTGGGVVDHRADWTYALVIPRGHPLEELRATQSYRVVHEALAAALRAQNVAAATKERPEPDLPAPAPTAAPAAGPAGVCFQRAEIYDVVNEPTGEKIAGAAQKRNKHGLLFQGSIWRPAAGGDAVDWDKFQADFTAGLAAALGMAREPTPWPDFNEDEVSGLIEQYSSSEWNEHR
ncbi:MAG: lipoate--protein ligase family protein [Opitutus sp.]|nr:lipoate--protein ligase family protein [Opitutus sp.]